MTLKLFQLNIFKGKFLPAVIDYIKTNDFDVVTLQEVTGGEYSFSGADCFLEIVKATGYLGEKTVAMIKKNDPGTYFSNTTFYKSNFNLLHAESIWMKAPQKVNSIKDVTPIDMSRSALALEFNFSGQKLTIVNTHMAWNMSPLDTPEKERQAQALLHYVEKISTPFVLAGDFNLTPETNIIKTFNKLGRNLVTEHIITNTLNPHTHKVKELFPKGLAVDYIFLSKELTVKNFKLVDSPDLSDHFGLEVDVELQNN